MNVIEEVRKFVKAEFEKPEALYKDAFENHFRIVVRISLELAEKQDADKEIVEIAAWLHDIGSIRGQYEDHHIVSAKIADELLTKLEYPKEKLEAVKHCIINHRGSKRGKPETKEAQILIDADSLSHFEDIEGLVRRVFNGDGEKMLAKLTRSYAKLSENAKPLVKERLEIAREKYGK